MWARARAIDRDGLSARTTVLEGIGAPDMAVVDALARWLLEARRAGWRVVVDYLAPELAELIDLAGLSVEVEGQPEGRE